MGIYGSEEADQITKLSATQACEDLTVQPADVFSCCRKALRFKWNHTWSVTPETVK